MPATSHTEMGERYMAAQNLMVAAQMARATGLTVADLHTCVTESILEPGELAPGADVPALAALADGPSEQCRDLDAEADTASRLMDDLEAKIAEAKSEKARLVEGKSRLDRGDC